MIGVGVSLRASLAAGKFSPRALFALSEPGVWYDPSDLTTMFQDRAGTTLVTTPGQSVGLVLDKRLGLTPGPELVTNGDFSDGTTGWTLGAGWSVTSGVAVRDGTVGASNLSGGAGVEIGKTYRVTWTQTGSSFVAVYLGSTSGPLISNTNVSGTYSVLAVATVTGGVVFRANAAVSAIDNISVREIPGNHMVATADASRGTYGVEPFGGRRNLLLNTVFNGAVAGTPGTAPAEWTNGFSTGQIASVETSSFGDGNSVRVVTSATRRFFFQSLSLAANTSCLFSIYAEVFTGCRVDDLIRWTNQPTGSTNLNNIYVDGVLTNSDVVLSAGTYRLAATITIGATAGTARASWGVGVVRDTTGDVRFYAPQAELGSTATPYQRVTTAFDVTEAGVPTVHYVQFDGADDGYLTSTITPGTDKAQVFAGVRKLSDAAQGIVAEHSTIITNNGSINLNAPAGAGLSSADYAFQSNGTVLSSATAADGTFNAPVTSVVTGLGDISGDLATLRVNGTQVAQSTADQGTGNYLAYPLYIGRRGGTSLPFNGRLYQMVVRFGPNLDASRIEQVERFINSKTGAY